MATVLWIVGIAVVVIAIVAGVLINDYENTHSISYKDGYVAGQQIINGSSASNSASNDCNNAWLSAPNNPGDNIAQWYAGCVAGWNAAEHPGASSNRSNSGNSGNSGGGDSYQQVPGPVTYSCPPGWTLEGTECYRNTGNS